MMFYYVRLAWTEKNSGCEPVHGEFLSRGDEATSRHVRCRKPTRLRRLGSQSREGGQRRVRRCTYRTGEFRVFLTERQLQKTRYVFAGGKRSDHGGRRDVEYNAVVGDPLPHQVSRRSKEMQRRDQKRKQRTKYRTGIHSRGALHDCTCTYV